MLNSNDSDTGIPEWNVKVGHLCRIDSKPVVLDFDVEAGYKKETDDEDDDEEETEEVLLPQEMDVPAWAAIPNAEKKVLDDKLLAKIKKGAGLASSVDKYVNMVKDQEKKTKQIGKAFDSITTEFHAVSS